MSSDINLNLDDCSEKITVDLDFSEESGGEMDGIHISVYDGDTLKHSISIERPERGGIRISDESLKALAAMVRP